MMSFEEFKTKGNSFYKKGDYETAAIYYEKAINEDPNNPIGYSNISMALIKLEKWEESIVQCNDGLQLLTKTRSDLSGKIRNKLLWRKETALKGLKKMEVERLSSKNIKTANQNPMQNIQHPETFINIPIVEVDTLPEDYI
ncbi:Tah1p SCDLUD_001175 [Saccharomycodes ludwigii]|uniref:Tah1p n=1 Tax=Saccharomycodes ludwigii TaxID=36035 RepID=UPI001E872623|nr:hypothetical protein SCDLUD_001175 [Saccharomycodes ludwigii]KAH3903534.1 hypothetical protein SCDLUD_001175 [Saccharomycodes ludwigii]